MYSSRISQINANEKINSKICLLRLLTVPAVTSNGHQVVLLSNKTGSPQKLHFYTSASLMLLIEEINYRILNLNNVPYFPEMPIFKSIQRIFSRCFLHNMLLRQFVLLEVSINLKKTSFQSDNSKQSVLLVLPRGEGACKSETRIFDSSGQDKLTLALQT